MADIFELFQKIRKEEPAPAAPLTHIVVGLGNPGPRYARTRHNAGFMALDSLAAHIGAAVTKEKFHALIGDGMLGGRRVLLMKPITMMNASGIAVRDAAEFYRIPPENILVLVDDVYLAPGRMRVRAKGSDGGHNGMENIIDQLESDAFPRIRFGVGQKPTPEYDLADWVVAPLPPVDLARLTACFPMIPDAAKMIFDGQTDRAMGLCNGFRGEADAGEAP
jgi:PTH1 family peptidyl-tRNA hydrolase